MTIKEIQAIIKQLFYGYHITRDEGKAIRPILERMLKEVNDRLSGDLY